ncbi:hypothetical protein SAMD00019534_068990 [Acytostelium subglobosum LB1]|uniref:hypothetical protein n=1 Tax=Acytostelium subglobosum LB1 TaxID=1410327 RepID=UPI0006447FB9|nr:hypothetical protein SAMD00019534_068990 [Acytostelium subglobosum LB1]GAM23724.1 hypothetical protein SAMD00019534_068990 [Acytostelium subglobosum LB1]|eukprot:XP_012753465.1 hypothetical protein SAMD00019534_068990 [Acytostelium subglobosum LB1]
MIGCVQGSIYGITIESSFEKTIQLFGLNPKEIMTISEKAIDFWTFQNKLYHQQEAKRLEFYEDQYSKLKTTYIKQHDDFMKKIDQMKKQIEYLKKENESDKKEIVELSEKCAEKTRQKRKLEELYENLKRKLEEVPSYNSISSNISNTSGLGNTQFAFSTGSSSTTTTTTFSPNVYSSNNDNGSSSNIRKPIPVSPILPMPKTSGGSTLPIGVPTTTTSSHQQVKHFPDLKKTYASPAIKSSDKYMYIKRTPMMKGTDLASGTSKIGTFQK